MGGVCSGALHTGHTSMQAFVSSEEFLQQEDTVNIHGISFCNTCADTFLMKVSIILKKKNKYGSINIWEQSEVGKWPNTHNYDEKIFILQIGYRCQRKKYKSYFAFILLQYKHVENYSSDKQVSPVNLRQKTYDTQGTEHHRLSSTSSFCTLPFPFNIISVLCIGRRKTQICCPSSLRILLCK